MCFSNRQYPGTFCKDTWQSCMNCIEKYEVLMKNYLFSSVVDSTQINGQTGPPIAQKLMTDLRDSCPYMQALIKRFKRDSN